VRWRAAKLLCNRSDRVQDVLLVWHGSQSAFDGLLMVAKNEKGRLVAAPMFFSELLAVSCRLSGLRRPDAAFLFIRAARTHLERTYKKLTGLGAQEIPKRLLKNAFRRHSERSEESLLRQE